MKTRCKPGDTASLDPKGTVFIRPPSDALSKELGNTFQTLPNDCNLRLGVFLECLAIIQKAKNPGQITQPGKRVDVPYLRLVQSSMLQRKGGGHD